MKLLLNFVSLTSFTLKSLVTPPSPHPHYLHDLPSPPPLTPQPPPPAPHPFGTPPAQQRRSSSSGSPAPRSPSTSTPSAPRPPLTRLSTSVCSSQNLKQSPRHPKHFTTNEHVCVSRLYQVSNPSVFHLCIHKHQAKVRARAICENNYKQKACKVCYVKNSKRRLQFCCRGGLALMKLFVSEAKATTTRREKFAASVA